MTILMRGLFTWDGAERRSDRYGTFAVVDEDEGTTAVAWVRSDALRALSGQRVSIICRVTETRQSHHIGDIFRGIFPSTPEIGTVIDLGVGSLIVESADWACGRLQIGLEPDDGREADWLDPEKLYQLHHQTVEVEVQLHD